MQADKKTAPSSPDVIYPGQRGAFTEEAAFDFVPAGTTIWSLPCLKDVFETIALRKASYGVVPLENTVGGTVGEAYDLLAEYPVVIVDETIRRLAQCLIAMKGTSVESLRRVYAHPFCMPMCSGFLGAHPGIEPVAVPNTAAAVARVMQEGLPDRAAIAGRRSARLYGAQILARDIENSSSFTRFVLIAASRRAPIEGDDSGIVKTTVSFQVPQPGALGDCIQPIVDSGAQITSIVSRPAPGRPFEYVYFVDLVGSLDMGEIAEALASMDSRSTRLRVHGSYPFRTTTLDLKLSDM